jgi:RNA polymerase sigma factor (sigma-70 family)
MTAEAYRVRARPLTAEQTLTLLREYAAWATQHGAQSAPAVALRNRIVEGNVGLVFLVWKMHSQRLVPLDDALGIGAQGLITAVERFDAAHGVRFSTYATWWIRHSLCRTGRNEGFTIRVPIHAQSGEAKTGERVDAAQAARRLRSLDTPMEGSRTTYGNMMPDEQALAAFDAIDDDNQRAALTEALAALPAQLRAVLEQRSEGRTLADVAEALGLRREKVRQLEA